VPGCHVLNMLSINLLNYPKGEIALTGILKKPHSNRSDSTELLALGYMLIREFARNEPFTASLIGRRKTSLFSKLWAQFAHLSMIDEFRAESIFNYLEDASDKPGNVAECGVCSGGTSLFIASVLRDLRVRKKVYMFDGFAGLPEPDRQYDRYYEAGSMKGNYRNLLESINRYNLADYCVVRKGWFSETLPKIPPDDQFCFVHVDCDLHKSAVECLVNLYPKIVPGGAIVFDDYYDGSGGVQRALNDWAAETREIIFLGPFGQAAILKGMTPSIAKSRGFVAKGTRSPTLSVERLRNQTNYARYLRQLSQLWKRGGLDIERFVAVCEGRAGRNPDLRSTSFLPFSRALARPNV